MNEAERNRATTQALIVFSNEIPCAMETLNKVHRYFEFVYDIGFHHGKRQNSHRKPVEQLKKGKVVMTYPSARHAARVLGVNKGTISKRICDGIMSRNGCTFRYKKI